MNRERGGGFAFLYLIGVGECWWWWDVRGNGGDGEDECRCDLVLDRTVKMLRLHRGNTGFVGCPGDSGGGVCAPCTEAVSSLQRGFRSKLWPLAARHPPLAHPCFLSHTHTHMHKRKIHLPHPLISWPAAFIGAPDCCVPPHSL